MQPPVEFFTVDIGDGVTLDGWMLKPSHFDSTTRYPVIVYVYGEPAGQTVVDRWGGGRCCSTARWPKPATSCVSVDNRGTPAPKGAAWRKVIYGAVGDLSSKEQAAAIRALAAPHSFIDPRRVGDLGLERRRLEHAQRDVPLPRRLQGRRVGRAGARSDGSTTRSTRSATWGCRRTTPTATSIGSPINFAEGLKGKLLVVHGSGDDNVHYQGTERLVNRLVELGKPFDVMVYPNRTHAISEGPGHDAARLPADRALLPRAPAAGRAMKVAIVGGPGIGKSTLVRQLGDLYHNGSYGEGEKGVWDPRVLEDIAAGRNPVGVTAYFAWLYDANYRDAADHDRPGKVIFFEGARITLEAHIAEYPAAVPRRRCARVLAIGDGWNARSRDRADVEQRHDREAHPLAQPPARGRAENMVRRFRLIDAEFRRLAPACPEHRRHQSRRPSSSTTATGCVSNHRGRGAAAVPGSALPRDGPLRAGVVGAREGPFPPPLPPPFSPFPYWPIAPSAIDAVSSVNRASWPPSARGTRTYTRTTASSRHRRTTARCCRPCPRRRGAPAWATARA